jgi:hypothetical protein
LWNIPSAGLAGTSKNSTSVRAREILQDPGGGFVALLLHDPVKDAQQQIAR